MRTNGQLCKCDRCGVTHFIKLLKTGDTDGGFNHWEKFEEAVGWGNVDGMLVCPYCYSQYKNLLSQYKSQKIMHFSFECCGNCDECQKENCVNRLDGEDG